MRSILYPKPHNFKFFNEIMKILFIFFLIACVTYTFMLPRLSVLSSMALLLWTFSDLVTIICPP